MSKYGDELTPLDLVLVARSAKAWLVRDGAETEAWLPFSLAEPEDGARPGMTVTLEVPLWWVEKAGLE